MRVFPSDRLETPALLLSTAPAFWHEVYDGRELVDDYWRGVTLQERQLDQTAEEFHQSLSRADCPVCNFWQWLPVTIREDARAAGRLLEYGDGLVYGTQ